MKKNYLYIFATALVVGFSSCSDFLDRYPQEELFMMGGTLAENCGYRLEPIESFEEVFERVSKKSPF